MQRFSSVHARFSALVTCLALGLMAIAAGPAAAQTATPAIDYTGMVDGGKTELTAALSNVGPGLFALLGILMAVGWAWMKFKQSRSSS